MQGNSWNCFNNYRMKEESFHFSADDSFTAVMSVCGMPVGALIHENLFLHQHEKKEKVKCQETGMRLPWQGNTSGDSSDSPINEPINASSLIIDRQSPLALPLSWVGDTHYCFHGNWYSHLLLHVNIQLHFIWLLSVSHPVLRVHFLG